MDFKSVNCESPKIHSDDRHKRLEVFSRRFSSFSDTVRLRLLNFFSEGLGRLIKEDCRLCTLAKEENGGHVV